MDSMEVFDYGINVQELMIRFYFNLDCILVCI